MMIYHSGKVGNKTDKHFLGIHRERSKDIRNDCASIRKGIVRRAEEIWHWALEYSGDVIQPAHLRSNLPFLHAIQGILLGCPYPVYDTKYKLILHLS